MIGFIAKKIFGSRNDRVLKEIAPTVARINELEPTFKKMRTDQLPYETAKLKERVEKGESLDSILPEAFALVREASSRVLGMRHFDVQLIGGMILHSGRIAEMRTGEGKTLVATLPAYLNALTGRGVHVVTVNDYLARRDSEWMGRLHRSLGLEVGVVYSGLNEELKRAAYAADITYGQNNEFGFDYLRDNMKFSLDEQFQLGHHYAIVDEVDSILIDEARTPLIISGPAEEATDKYQAINQIIPRLIRDQHYQMDERHKQPSLTEEGVARAEELLSIENLYDPNQIETLHHVSQALRAHTTMNRDQDYVVMNGQVIIVDEFTGRLMPGRRWSNGLHQAVEAKEGLKIARENQTLASVTFQNYFRMYEKLSGMTGTADTEAVEFKQIYNLEVVVIPTNRPMVRNDQSDKVFRSRREKYDAVVADIIESHKTGQPILVGTISIEQSEFLAQQLASAGVEHNVLNAKQHEREAEIVAQAGRFGSVTISTNMAGRGTDIMLGGNPEFLAQAASGTKDHEDPAYREAFERFKRECDLEKEQVVAAGGLSILGTERHESRRIDNQLRGRAGRQGDAGSTRFYVSLEDELMKRFGGDKIQSIMTRLGWEEGMPMEGGMISGSIETAQKRVEAFHFESRKHVTEYDDVMNKQRQVVYNLRSKILKKEDVGLEFSEMVEDVLEDTVLNLCDEKAKAIEWDLEKLQERFKFLFACNLELPKDFTLDRQTVFDFLRQAAKALYQERSQHLEAKLTELRSCFEPESNPFDFTLEEVQQDIILRTLDHLWLVHLQEMDHLREGIGLRGYGQKNPLHEYQKEGFVLFQQTVQAVKEAVVRQVYHYELPDAREYMAHLETERRRREEITKQMRASHESVLDVGAAGAAISQESAAAQAKSAEDQRARLAAQRKARRKLNR